MTYVFTVWFLGICTMNWVVFIDKQGIFCIGLRRIEAACMGLAHIVVVLIVVTVWRMLSELASEVKVSKVTWRSVWARSRRSEARIATPSRSCCSRPQILRQCRMEDWYNLISFGYSSDLLISARAWIGIDKFIPTASRVNSGRPRVPTTHKTTQTLNTLASFK